MFGPWRGLLGHPYSPWPSFGGLSSPRTEKGPKEPFGSCLCHRSVLPLLSLSFSFGDIGCPLSPTVLGVREGTHRMTREERRKLQQNTTGPGCPSGVCHTAFPQASAHLHMLGLSGRGLWPGSLPLLQLWGSCLLGRTVWQSSRPLEVVASQRKQSCQPLASSSSLCCLPTCRGR